MPDPHHFGVPSASKAEYSPSVKQINRKMFYSLFLFSFNMLASQYRLVLIHRVCNMPAFLETKEFLFANEGPQKEEGARNWVEYQGGLSPG